MGGSLRVATTPKNLNRGVSDKSSSSSKWSSAAPEDLVRSAILLTDKCTRVFWAWRDQGESFRADRYKSIQVEGLSLEQFKVMAIKVQHLKTCINAIQPDRLGV